MKAAAALPPAITAALNTWPADQARPALEVIEAALAPLPAVDHPTWTRSKLGRRGFPFEMTFKGGADDLRYTVEVDRPDRPPHGRLRRALEVARGLGGAQWPGDVVEALLTLHHNHREELTYGAWLGVRHGQRLGLKLYTELPQAAPSSPATALVESIEERWGFSTWGGARPVLLGVEAGRLELYYQVHSPRARELSTVLRRAGFEAHRAPGLRAPLERAFGLSLDRGMPAPQVGISYGLATEPEDGVLTVTLYHPADTVFGGDRTIRRRWLDLHGLDLHGDVTGRYAAVTAPLETVGGRGGALHHGMFGVAVPRDAGDAVLALGLTPPLDVAA